MNDTNDLGNFIVKILVVVAITIAGYYLIKSNKSKSNDSAEFDELELVDEETVTSTSNDGDFVISETEWRALQKEVEQLKNELAEQKAELDKLKQNPTKPTATQSSASKKVSSAAQTTTAHQNIVTQQAQSSSTSSTPTAINADDVTISNYTHDWLKSMQL